MKKTTLRTFSLLLVLAFCLSSIAFAAPRRASDYIESCYASAARTSTGGVKITFDIIGTGVMTSIGATQIDIKNSAGTIVKTYKNTQTGYGYMVTSNALSHRSSVTYPGISGNQYYAVVYFKAANRSGSDTDSYTTGFVTA